MISETDYADATRLVALAQGRDAAMSRVGAAAVRSLLQDALAVVTGESWQDPNVCPVCDATGTAPLRDRLDAKITLYEEATRLDNELASAVLSSSAIAKLREVEEYAAFGISAHERLSAQLGVAKRATSFATEELAGIGARLEELARRREELIKATAAELAELQAKLPPSLIQVSRKLSLAKQFRDAVKEYSESIGSLRANEKKVVLRTRWKTFIAGAAQLFGDAETALANARLTQIHDSCQTLFGQLVRGGPDVKPTLSRAQNNQNVELKLQDFFGLHNLSARALLSESYRNAVASAIFLSAAVKHNGTARFIVLDDVTSSFDAGHQFSLMDAIRSKLRFGAVVDGAEVAESIQFIILSHDSSLEKYFDKLNGTTEWHHQKLQGMPPKGRLMVSTHEADRLKAQAHQFLSAGQIEIGQPFLRQYLEYKLGQIITKLEVPVPPDYATRGDKRTLSTYIDAILEAVRLYQATGQCPLTAQQIYDLQNHHALSIMGNFVVHYETGAGTPFNAYALLGVLQSVDDLSDCFTYIDTSNRQKRFYRRLDRR